MSRPLRIEYPGAWYHVMNRVRRGERIFEEKTDYKAFIELLKESAEIWNLTIAAYCLMPTHYHLLIQTPDANISRAMRHINGVYTQRFNRTHRCDGQLFRGRYRAILVEADSFLLQLLRYIHRNPYRAGLVERVDSYPWSSHKGYLSNDAKWNWLKRTTILSMLSEHENQQRKAYRQFISQKDSEELTEVFRGKRLPSILGTEAFSEWVRDTFFSHKRHREIPDSKALAPGRERIMQVVCEAYQVEREGLLQSRRGTCNEPRNVAIYLTRKLRGEGLVEICQEYGLGKHSSAGSVIERVKKELARDKQFKRRVEELETLLTKSQTET
jgi:putative transposase